MKKRWIIATLLVLSTLSQAQKMQIVNGDTLIYLTQANLSNLQKTKQLVTQYNNYQKTRKKNKEKLWQNTRKIIESTSPTPNKNIVMNRRTFIVLFYYHRIVYRYQLVKKRPKTYKKFWAGWYCRYMSRLIPYYKKL